MESLMNSIPEFNYFLESLSQLGGKSFLLIAALFAALAFEFVNGFHDTANAVATVIYTKSLKPWIAVTVSGIFNFLGVLLGGIVVAIAIIKLLPAATSGSGNLNETMAMIFALLLSAITWNLATWYVGLPASSSHTLFGSIIGVGLAQSIIKFGSFTKGVNWGKAADITIGLVVSPLFGFCFAGVLLLLSKKFIANKVVHESATSKQSPPWYIRGILILTSSGVSFAHGSNDGQKGVGLIMLILVSLMPAQFALRPGLGLNQVTDIHVASDKMASLIAQSNVPLVADSQTSIGNLSGLIIESAHAQVEPFQNLKQIEPLNSNLKQIKMKIAGLLNPNELNAQDKIELRGLIFKVDEDFKKLEKDKAPIVFSSNWKEIKNARNQLVKYTDYAPVWVIFAVALALGLGTMIGWKRIVKTIGEKIGNSHLTYAQGAAAEIVAMSTIGLSSWFGLPVSTTHVLSSGVAGTMVAGKSGVQKGTVYKIALAWVLTLPVSMLLSGIIYYGLTFVL